MQLTAEYIVNELELAKPNIEEYVVKVRSQVAMEIELLAASNSCNELDPQVLLKYLGQANLDILNSDVKVNFYHYPTMKAMQCLTTTALTPRHPSSPLSLLKGINEVNGIEEKPDLYGQRVRDLLSFSKTIGGTTNVFRGHLSLPSSIDENKSNLVIKTPSDEDKHDLLHECVVAFYATNLMRSQGVPNFAFIYGSFDCSVPIVDPVSHRALSYCNSSDPLKMVSYVIYERVEGIDYDDYIRDHNTTLKNTFDIFLQTLLALDSAKPYHFVHYDLHGGNLIVTTPSATPFYIRYPTSQGVKYFLSKGEIATMIDFGMSYIEIDGQSYGRALESNVVVEGGVYPDKYLPLHDVHKMLCNTAQAYLSNFMMDKYEEIKPLLQFFTDEPPEEYLRGVRKVFFALPYTDRTRSLTVYDFITYFLDYYRFLGLEIPLIDLPENLDPNIPILGDNNHRTFIEEITRIGLGSNHLSPKSFREFLYQYHNTSPSNEKEEKALIIQNFTRDLQSVVNTENLEATKWSLSLKRLYREGEQDYHINIVVPSLPADFKTFNKKLFEAFYLNSVNFIVGYRSLWLMCSTIQDVLKVVKIGLLENFLSFYLQQLKIFKETYIALLTINKDCITYLSEGIDGLFIQKSYGRNYIDELQKLQ
jgi:serine/threonine protein kinase